MSVEPPLPLFELGDPHHPPNNLEDLFPIESECIDFDAIIRQKNDVQLAIHRYEVPLVNTYLHGVKMKNDDMMQARGTSY